MAAEHAVDRPAIAGDLERARIQFQDLLADAQRLDAWHGPTRGTRWTNEQLSFHTWCLAT